MIVQSVAALYSAAVTAPSPSSRQASAATLPANVADTVRISQAAREALAASSPTASSPTAAANGAGSVAARLAEIRAKGPVNRSQEDHDFLFANDRRLAEISAQGKSPDQLTADELDYLQKATGFVNTFATLSPAEKALYDKAVASGNTEAAAGIAQIALIRMGGHTAGGANGTTYDPRATDITAANVSRYFSHGIVDASGEAQSRFQALIRFLGSVQAGAAA